MKCNKNTNFRITFTLCALEYVHLIVAEVPPTGNSLVPQRSCVSTHSPLKSIILRMSRNFVLQSLIFLW